LISITNFSDDMALIVISIVSLVVDTLF